MGRPSPSSDCRLAMSRAAEEQSGREFASADATARAQDAALQIARISPTVLVYSRRRPEHFQRPTPSHFPPHTPRPPRRGDPHMASARPHEKIRPSDRPTRSSHGTVIDPNGAPQSDRHAADVRNPARHASKNATARMKPAEPFSILYGKHEIQKPSAGSWSRLASFSICP